VFILFHVHNRLNFYFQKSMVGNVLMERIL